MLNTFSFRGQGAYEGSSHDEICCGASLSSAHGRKPAILFPRFVDAKIRIFFFCALVLSFRSVAGAYSGNVEQLISPEDGMYARGQHLLMDLAGSSFEVLNDKEGMTAATLSIIEQTGMTLLGIQSYKLEPQGVSVVATLAESHLTIHTWPEWGKALIDLFTCGSKFNLQDAVPIVAQEYGGNLSLSTFSVVPRGDLPEDEKAAMELINKQFQPLEVMGTHKYKQLVYETESSFQKISIWDHHDYYEDSYTKEVTRSLFLDHVMQSNVHDEERYHETLVHPAFIASSRPIKRVLIVGGGEGGTLRECLKWKSVETVTMVEIDEEVISASRKYLPSYNNCTGFGHPECFEDKRLELFTEDFFDWFEEVFGSNICQEQDKQEIQDKLYDVIILDLLDIEELPEGEPWAADLYSSSFFERLSCALNPSGVLVTNFGEAPESPYDSGPILSKPDPVEVARFKMFQNKIEKIQAMSSHFLEFTVYDLFVMSFRGQWAFAIGIGPTKNTPVKEVESASNVALFYGTAEEINLKLRGGLKPGAHPLTFYSGRVQNSFKYPTAGWRGVYCKANKDICAALTQNGVLSSNCTGAECQSWHPLQEYLVKNSSSDPLEVTATDDKNKTPRFIHYMNDLIAFQSVDAGSPSSLLGAGYIKVEENSNAFPKELTVPSDASDLNGTIYPEVSGCRSLWGTSQSIWDEDTFKKLQDTYRMVVAEDKWSIATFPTSGFVIPHEIRQSSEKGRGVFATSHVPKGTLVWHPAQHAEFPDETTFRRFLSSLPWELACDILQWAYVEEVWKEEYKVAVELDQGSLVNHGSCDEANVGELEKGEFIIAIRDIEAGEEFLQDYTTFDNDSRIPWYDEMVDHAFGGDDRIEL